VKAAGLAAWLAVAAVQGLGAGREPIVLTPGLVITRSTTVRPGRYELPASDLKTPAITVRGENITVDFAGATLAGGADGADPDSYDGLGILIDGGRGVTIRHLTVRGYKVGLLARRSSDLRLTENDLSYNWKQRLYSGIEKESLVDWMSYHRNEDDEWLRYGAGVYLSECDRAQIDHNTIVQGQNGVLVTKSSGLRIWNNTLQFLSGIGLGLYRVTGSTIMHNRIDWCVRGYSHGFYNRGQDSAGLLMYEQSSRNAVAYNSITHGGDGLFLWAGQSTMDTGEGGSNDNRFQANDFSHAVTNGIEATFSRNLFVENRVEDCWHGVWGGYSYDSQWVGNRFARNAEAIAIEHGQHNVIAGNSFQGDDVAVRLWQNDAQDPSWGYPKRRDTRSQAYLIADNTFGANATALDIRRTRGVTLRGNAFDRVGTPLLLEGAAAPALVASPAVQVLAPESGIREAVAVGIPAPPLPGFPGAIDPMIKEGERRGRETIVVDEWGPFDWKSPKLWPAGKPAAFPLTLRVLGPAGEWTLAHVRGATVSAKAGRVPGELTVIPSAGAAVDFSVDLDYRGGDVVSARGARTPAGAPYRFSYAFFFVPIDWLVRFFEYSDLSDPVKQPEAFRKLVGGRPIKTVSVDRLDYISGRSLEEGVPRDRVALVAEGTASLPDGEYTLRVISDDGVRVWVDGKLVLDAWMPHESKVDEATISGGRRTFRVEHYEVGGFAELRVDLRKPTPRARPQGAIAH
jgi:nitrous oxidase accessory protein NosD